MVLEPGIAKDHALLSEAGDGVTLYKSLGKLSDILHLNDMNNQLERQAWSP